MFDASTPPASPRSVAPGTWAAVAGYIGGPTPHIWSAEEWGRFGTAHSGLKKLPIWVAAPAVHAHAARVGFNVADLPSPAAADMALSADAEAWTALRRLYALGVPKGSPVVWDMETAVASTYLRTVGAVLEWGGYLPWVYGSASTVFDNPPLHGYWVADYAGKGPFMFDHPEVRATQYASGPAVDSSTVKPWQYEFRMRRW